LPKFKKSLQEAATHQDKWLYLISHLENLQEVPPELQENIYKEFLHKAEICELTKEEFDKYQGSLKNYRDATNIQREIFEKGKLEGKAEGKVEGKVEEKIQIVRAMKLEGDNADKIARVTGLSLDEINKL